MNSFDKTRPILVPECGMAGFEILVARAAGFTNIYSYDIHPEYVKCCQRIWQDVKYTVSSTESYNFSNAIKNNFLVIIPHWSHSASIIKKNFLSINIIDIYQNISKVTFEDIELFYEKLEALKQWHV
jgi:hypothetical protein